ncbi:flavin reductase (DIM6/NTAB) family NADH-FMN oxidoreductase RutF [Rhizobium tibeticum]|uniref:flavin reductase family protein n=1 Tax=Rhizobium tibeticum TaxID=501024 RepID=UPI00277D5E86|nr:flavin reductase family protein [Rhizobium tibeticum]MDP9813703.1 flavin reductase (DIM6/NTAB) family NADH-FMN oxidoreductase RutF [Rhizobium tibeticum]
MAPELKTAFDQQAFRQALGQFPTGVCVVTCTAEFERLGMTMSSFNCLSLDPPLILFSIDRKAASLPLWEKAEGYAVNVLAENQKEISNRFAKSLSNKWEGTRFAHGQFGAPLLPGVAAVFECIPWAKYDGGDHTLFIAEVTSFSSSVDRMPLVFSKGRYAALQSTEFVAPLWPLDIHY